MQLGLFVSQAAERNSHEYHHHSRQWDGTVARRRLIPNPSVEILLVRPLSPSALRKVSSHVSLSRENTSDEILVRRIRLRAR